MRPFALGLSGRIRSGKTTLSTALSKALLCRRASFGDYVRFEAHERGLEVGNRQVLQDLGELLGSLGWKTFCRNVLHHAGWKPGQPIVIDGLRHVEAIHALRDLVNPLEFRLIYISIAEGQLSKRLLQDASVIDIGHIEEHSTEYQVVETLPSVADLLVDGSRPVEQLVDEIVQWILLA